MLNSSILQLGHGYYEGSAHKLIAIFSVFFLLALTIGIIDLSPLSAAIAAQNPLVSLGNGTHRIALENKALEGMQANQSSIESDVTLAQNQDNGQGIGDNTVPIPYSGIIWNLLGPSSSRNLPTASTVDGAACSGDQGGDTDGDNICDYWESSAAPNSASNRYIRCPTNGGVPLDSLCTSIGPTGAKYDLCFKDQYADVWGPPHVSGETICPRLGHKDVFVEIDWMTNHHPDDNAIKDVIKAFGNSPVTNTETDAFGRTGGITLHVILDEQLTRVTPIWAWKDSGSDDGIYNNDFKSIKERHFGFLNNPANIDNPADERASCPANAPCSPSTITSDLTLLLKHYVYHYSTYIVNWQGTPATSCGPSGTGEILGNDMIVSLGCQFVLTDSQGHSDLSSGCIVGGTAVQCSVGSRDEQAGTFMHELGHNLNLAHGGPALSSFGSGSSQYNTNCKPNELSVMSYSRQVPGAVSSSVWESNKFLDYSRAALTTLVEGALDEARGIGSSTTNVVVYGPPAIKSPTVLPGGWIDWNANDGSGPDSGTVSADLNNIGISGGCTGSGTTLMSMDEWNPPGLQYYFLNDFDGQDGLRNPAEPLGPIELTGEMVQNLTKLGHEFSGLLDPINSNGTSVFQQGETIPVKFQLRDAKGNIIPDAKVTFTAERINGSSPGSKLLSSYKPTPFNYDDSNKTYVLNWPTSELQDGAWAIYCLLNFGAHNQTVLQGSAPIHSGMSGIITLKLSNTNATSSE